MLTPAPITKDGESIEVASASPSSDTAKWVLLQVPGGRFALYTGDGILVQLLPEEITHHNEPRWSRFDPRRLYFLEANKLMGFVIGTDTQGQLATAIYTEHEFAEYETVKGFGEGDLSEDGDHLFLGGIKGGIVETFVFEISTEKKTEVQQFVAGIIDGLKLAGNIPILSRGAHGPSDGIFVLENGGERRLADANGHAATYKHFLLWCTSDSPTWNANALAMTEVATGASVELTRFNWGKYAFHVSTCEQPFCLVSTDCPDNSLPAQLWKVAYDLTPPELLYEWPNVFHKDYEVRAALSRDGSRVYFNKFDGQQVNVWMLRLDGSISIPISPVAEYLGYDLVSLKGLSRKKWLIELSGDGTWREFEKV